MLGETPMTKIKIIGLIFGLPVMLLLAVLVVQNMNHTTVTDDMSHYSGSTVSYGRIVGGNGTAHMEVAPLAAPTLPPVVTVKPTGRPAATADNEYYPPGSKYNPLPSGYLVTPTPTPVVKTNDQYVDEHNFVKVIGLNTDYKLKANDVIKVNSKVDFSMSLQNMLPSKVDKISGTLTISSYAMDMGLNTPVLPATYSIDLDFGDHLDLRQYDSHRVEKSITVPNLPGKYLIMLNIHGDNGALCQISEMVTIKS